MIKNPKKIFSLLSIILGLLLLGFFYQNLTTVDFTEDAGPRQPPSPLERAILKADKEQSVRKRKLGVDDRQIHKKYLKRERKPSAVGDLPFSEIQKHKKPKHRQRPAQKVAPRESAPSAAQRSSAQ